MKIKPKLLSKRITRIIGVILCIAIITLAILAIKERNNLSAEIAKVEKEELKAATVTGTVGTNVSASFDSSTGTLKIGSTGSSVGTIVINDLSNFTFHQVGDENVKRIEFTSRVKAPTDCTQMFSSYENLETIELSYLDTSDTTKFNYMFSDCEKLTSISQMYVNHYFSSSNVTSCWRMFWGCTSLKSIGIFTDHAPKLVDAEGMFYDCKSLTESDFPAFYGNNLEKMSYMFEGCTSLVNCTGSHIIYNTDNVTDARRAFARCYNLKSLDLFAWNLSKNTGGDIGLSSCPRLIEYVTPKANASETILGNYGTSWGDFTNEEYEELYWERKMYNNTPDDYNDKTYYKKIEANAINKVTRFAVGEKVYLDHQGGTGGYQYPERGIYNQYLPNISVLPTKEGYRLDGYYTETNGKGDKVYDSDGKPVAKCGRTWIYTVYANWVGNSYSISFDQQDGTGGTTSIYATYESEMPTITLPTKEGYTFDGYYSEKNGEGTQYYTATGASAKNWDKTSGGTLYAKWIPNTYTIAFDQQGGEGGSTFVTATYGRGMPEITKPTRTNYKFDGYYDAENGEGTQYYKDTGASARTWDKATTATLYAKWVGESYTVTLDTNGGTISSGNLTSYTFGTGATLPTNITKENCVFDGWYANSDFSGTAVTSISTSDSGNKEFYAKWKAVVATIGDNKYFTLQEAIDAVPTDGTETEIVIHSNVVEHLRIEGNRNIVIDVNGFIIRGSLTEVPETIGIALQHIFGIIGDGEETGTGTGETSASTIFIGPGSSLKLKGQGKVISDDGAAVENNGTFILDPSVELISNCKDPALENKGDATINGGKVTNTSDGPAIENHKDATLDINDGEIHSENGITIINDGDLTIDGGEITNNNKDNAVIDNNGTLTMTDGKVENLDGGTGIKNEEDGTLTVEGGSVIGVPAVDNSEGGEVNISDDADIQGDITEPDVTVTFKNGETIVDTQTIAYGGNATAPTLTKEGYTLSWDKELTNVKSDLEVNAIWTANTNTRYKIEYYLRDLDEEVEGYELSSSETVVKLGTTDTEAVITDADKKEITGFTFDSENTNNVLSVNIDGDGQATLKLYYSRNVYDIVYYLLPIINGNTGATIDAIENNIYTEQYTYGKEYILTTDVSWEGYVFNGWYNNSKYTGEKVTKIEAGETGTKHFYASWKDKEYIKLGDINEDGNVTLIDLSLINQAIVAKITLNDTQKIAADINKDGKVTLIDLSLINQVIVGKITL